MSSEPQAPTMDEIQIDSRDLYREETVTDLKVGSIRQLIPVTADGKPDTSRRLQFIGQTQLMTQMGPVPVQTRIEARTLRQAIEAFPAAIRQAIAAMMDEVRELQRQEMSRIVVPGAETTNKILGGQNPTGK